MNWNLKSGVLIVGSLLWQDYVHIKGDDIRRNWRDFKLDLDNKIAVKVPIRYGRLSSSKIPTIVFSNKMKNKLGFAYVVPLKSPINNHDQLICEAMALSVAEGMRGNFVMSWGILTYLINEKKINPEIKNMIVKCFRNKKNQSFAPKDYKVGREISCVTLSLKLNIDWIQTLVPSDQDRLSQFDLLLATATKPENEMLGIEKIAERIIADLERRYFLNNISHGIITYNDFEISKRLDKGQ
ncbi:MAG: hypothetical protein IH947_09860 [Bacteroidetes bacterium]|nr:hypothetical protein [Bacteroidota bacterium]